MAIWHGEKGKKPTGGLIHIARKKRKRELGSLPVHTKIGKEKKKIEKTKGGGSKIKASSVEFANVLDTANNAIKKVKILDVLENPANPHFTRRGIITKGSVIKTEIGNARVTSRPSQHGVVNAIILEKEKT
jgi:small subunit ribosomal protein S8e